MWQKLFSVILVIVVAATTLLFTQEEKKCCLCDSFRYHAPCLLDLATGELLEFDLYLPHSSSVAELAEEQPEMGTLSFVQIGNVSGIKLTDSKTIEIHIPDDKTFKPALCRDCRKLLPLGHTNRYILADLYDKQKNTLIPIKANTAFSLRCYEIIARKNTEKGGISVTVQGKLEQQ